MKYNTFSILMVLTTTLLFLTPNINSGIASRNQEQSTPPVPSDTKECYFLFSPWQATTTYLINETGVLNHTWHSTYYPLYDSYMADNGSIFLAIDSGNGGFQKIAYNNTVLWEYHYTRDSSYATHDIVPLPNGDVIIIMQEIKSRAQAIQAGRDPDTFGSVFYPDFLIQVNKTGPTSGDIVWEWHVWDHLIQDFDATKDNYGNVSQHPELANINFDQYWSPGWPYVNSVDYNPKFDQILISAHNLDEVWIIDHGTTTEEAAGHTGGHYGHGGDLLYRWGNPQTYNRGDASDKKLYFQHQCCWVKPGLPGAGNILVFSNGNTRPGGPISSVDEFTPDVNNDTGEYYLPLGGTYGPDDLSWQYLLPSNLFSAGFGGAQRMLNGNTFICSGWVGIFIEVTPDKQIVWTYVNPYPYPEGQVYRSEYIFPPPANKPPEQPTITGPSKAKINNATPYNFTTRDPEGDKIYFFVDWGDGTNSSWIGPYSSGATVTQSHAWTRMGTYHIKAKAKDINDNESDWSNPFAVTVIANGPYLDVVKINGGITSVKAILTNIGSEDAANVTWTIAVNGGLLHLINASTNGTVAILKIYQQQTVKANGVIGLGKITITVTATTPSANIVTKTVEGFAVGPFIVVKK